MFMTVGLWLLLALSVGAHDTYDDGSMDFKGDVSSYYVNDDSFDDSGQLNEKVPLTDMMMFKLMNSMASGNSDEWGLNYKPFFNTAKDPLSGWSHEPSEMDFKAAAVKRRVPAGKTPAKGIKVKPVIRQQPRWRIKRPPRLCLLKLCPSMYYTFE